MDYNIRLLKQLLKLREQERFINAMINDPDSPYTVEVKFTNEFGISKTFGYDSFDDRETFEAIIDAVSGDLDYVSELIVDNAKCAVRDEEDMIAEAHAD